MPDDPFVAILLELAMKARWAIPFGVLCGFLAAGLLFLASRPLQGEPVQLLPPPTAKPLQVYVAGAVLQPGIQALPPGSRVEDALIAAGGLLPEANPAVLNLAAFVEDGERIYVPLTSEPGGRNLSTDPFQPVGASLININTASQAELETLPGIGPVTATNIIAYRETNGGFISIDSILNVPGIGPKTLEEIQNLITVED
jgi:competence protein ComEA